MTRLVCRSWYCLEINSAIYFVDADIFQQKDVTAVGFEPTPFQTSALNWRLRPLGQAITAWHIPLNYSQHNAGPLLSLSHTIPTQNTTLCTLTILHTSTLNFLHDSQSFYYAPSISREYSLFSISHISRPNTDIPSLTCYQFTNIGPKYLTESWYERHMAILWLLQALKWGWFGEIETSITRHVELCWTWQLGHSVFIPLSSTHENFRTIGEGFIFARFLSFLKLRGHGRRGRGEQTRRKFFFTHTWHTNRPLLGLCQNIILVVDGGL